MDAHRSLEVLSDRLRLACKRNKQNANRPGKTQVLESTVRRSLYIKPSGQMECPNQGNKTCQNNSKFFSSSAFGCGPILRITYYTELVQHPVCWSDLLPGLSDNKRSGAAANSIPVIGGNPGRCPRTGSNGTRKCLRHCL